MITRERSDKVKLICENTTPDGKGIFEINNKRVYIPGILKGEEVEVEKNKRYELKRIITKSPLRIEVKCAQFDRCGGCQYLHMSYESEQDLKKKYINGLMKDIYNNKIPFTFMNNELYYRTKVQMTFKESKRHQLALGLYKENSHDIITVENCLLHNKKANELAIKILAILNKYKLRAYDEETNTGILRHLLIRYSETEDKALVVFVLATKILPKRKDIVKDIIALNMGVETIIENYNIRDTSIVLGEEDKIIYGTGFILDKILGKKFLIGSNTFYQINHEGVEKLYQKAIDKLELKGNETIIDAYCGVGTIGIIASSKAKNVIGIELNRQSIKLAINNAKINGVKNINFIAADATQKLNEMCLTNTKIDAIIMDPPRDGSTKQFISAIHKLKIKKVCYVSCEPTTLKRDLEIFKSLGYEIKSLECVDMFPRTFNVEAITLLGIKK